MAFEGLYNDSDYSDDYFDNFDNLMDYNYDNCYGYYYQCGHRNYLQCLSYH